MSELADDRVVLLADDEVDMLSLYVDFLETEYTVVSAGGGTEAIETFEANMRDIDAALLDRRMPEISGDKVLEHIRESPVDIPAAMVTAVDPGIEIIDLPCDKYVTKPVSKEDLVDTVEDLFLISDFTTVQRELIEKCMKLELLEQVGTGKVDHFDDRLEGLRDDIGELERELENIEVEFDFTEGAERQTQHRF